LLYTMRIYAHSHLNRVRNYIFRRSFCVENGHFLQHARFGTLGRPYIRRRGNPYILQVIRSRNLDYRSYGHDQLI